MTSSSTCSAQIWLSFCLNCIDRFTFIVVSLVNAESRAAIVNAKFMKASSILPFLLLFALPYPVIPSVYSSPPCLGRIIGNVSWNTPVRAHWLRLSSTCNIHVCNPVLLGFWRRPYLSDANQKMDNYLIFWILDLFLSVQTGSLLGLWRCTSPASNLDYALGLWAWFFCTARAASPSNPCRNCFRTP